MKHWTTVLLLVCAQWITLCPAKARMNPPSVFFLHPSSFILQATSPPQHTEQTTDKETPRMLLLIQRSDKTPLRNGDPITALSNTLEEALIASQRFDVVRYSPDQPSIKRALLEHRLAASDMLEPIKIDALQRMAHAIGATYALEVRPTFDKQGAITDLHFLEEGENQIWQTDLVDQVTVPAVSGKRHFKTDALVALTVDSITARLGYPSHLAEKIKVAPPRVIKVGSAPTDRTKERAQPGAQSAGSTGSTGNTAAGGNVPAASPPGNAAVSHTNESPNGGANGAGQSAPSRQVVRKSETRPQTQSSENTTSPPNDASGVNTRRAAKTPGHTPVKETPSMTVPAPVILAPANAEPAPDYANIAQHYEQSGDVSNAILALRRAIDDDPFNPALRRQLIQAYVERRMPDAAMEEARRAKLLIPEDNSLDRVYGDALLAKGDVNGALKVYREIVKRAPQDVAAQVALADALLVDNQFSEAVSAYEAATQVDPKSPLPHRRLARVYAERAESDPAQYQESLKQIALARTLTPTTDIDSYMGDYVALMQRMEARLRDMADALQGLYEAGIQGKKTSTELLRATEDMKERATALADYLDQVPPAAGQDDAHAHYTQGAALLLQAIGTFRRYLSDTNSTLSDARGALQVARVDTLSELTTAGKLLRSAQTTSNPTHKEEGDSAAKDHASSGTGQ